MTMTPDSTRPDSREPGSKTEDSRQELDALQTVIGALQPLDADARQRILESAATFLQIHLMAGAIRGIHGGSRSETRHPPFSQDIEVSPKEFLLEKQPRSDVERVACLAYYLTHYRDTPHFKTLELSKLNTEAAQPKFSNAANATNNAVKRGYLVPSTKGHRQLSAAGEQFVRALPDRTAAKAALASAIPRRQQRVRSRKSSASKASSEGQE